jgi:aminopeptidase YwaD
VEYSTGVPRRPTLVPLAVLLLPLLLVTTAAVASVVAPLDAAHLLAHVRALTAPEMEGRGSGTDGGDRAARYIAETLAKAGLRPGGEGGTFFQELVVATTPSAGAGSLLESIGPSPHALEVGRDWTPHGGSATGEASGELVFVAQGDYAAAAVRGRIALALAGPAAPGGGAGPTRLEQVVAARRAGARALLLVEDALPPVPTTTAPLALVSGSVTRAGAERLLAGSGRSLDELAAAGSAVVIAGASARLRVDIAKEERRAANVIGVLPGADPARAGEAVVVGAHYDHLGREGASVYHGADDNASGTAVVLGLAQALAGTRPPRTVVFALFTGEEIGLLGSAHHVRNPTAVPTDRMVAMLNFDMVGRLDGRRLVVGGVETGSGFRDLVEAAGREVGLDLDPRAAGVGPSDHTRFHSASVPVLFFHSGTHADYHRPSDTAEKIDAAGMARIARLGARVVAQLADGPRPVFARGPLPGPRSRAAARGGGAFLGIAPDLRAGWDGVRLGSIVPGSAAERAGLQAGDVLVRLADIGLRGFADLREQLDRRRPGETVRLVYIREGEDHATSVTLGARP